MSLTREKLGQAVSLVPRSGATVWLTFVRETSMMRDPVLPLILSGGLTWESALIVGADGRRVAVVGNYDADPLLASGEWDEVVPYVKGIREPLLSVLESMVPPGGAIAVNFSEDDVAADGLSHGMFRKLERMMAGTRFEGCLVGAADTVTALRAQKTATELARIRRAIAETDEAFAEIARFAEVGRSEREVYEHVHRWVRERAHGFSWDPVGDPIVNSGPDSMIGHGIPSP
ncbi:MAG: M24 family metallopeptidase, partial [Fimbriimonadaceae bacterium]